jgi:uncharacterized protein YeaO (DUF488 family)
MVGVKRVYDEPSPDDGVRVLVDRLWPRGVRKDAGRFDRWVPDVAPSTDLRRWYGHDPAKFGEFARRYRRELAESSVSSALDELARCAAQGPLTLLTASRDLAHAHTVVLCELLAEVPPGW